MIKGNLVLLPVSVLLAILIVSSCNSKSIRETKWKVVGITIDPTNNYADPIKNGLMKFDTSQGLYSYYKDSVLVNYLNGRVDITKYRQEGDIIIFYGDGFENDTTKILKF